MYLCIGALFSVIPWLIGLRKLHILEVLNVRRVIVVALALAALVMVTSWEWARPVSAQMPTVRIAVVPGGGSGMEQEVVDGINGRLSGDPSIALSTVNPDWYVICNILDKTDFQQMAVRVNGTVTIKTTDGHVVDTVSTMVNKQDFAVSPGQGVNRVLIDRAIREVISALVDRATPKIMMAVQIEMATRQKVVDAYKLAGSGRVAEAIAILNEISPDSPQYRRARRVISELRARGGGRRPAPKPRSTSQGSLNQAKIQAIEAKQKANTAEQKALQMEKSLLNGK